MKPNKYRNEKLLNTNSNNKFYDDLDIEKGSNISIVKLFTQ